MSMRDSMALVARVLLVALFLLSGFGKLVGFTGTALYLGAHGVPFPKLGVVIALLVELPALDTTAPLSVRMSSVSSLPSPATFSGCSAIVSRISASAGTAFCRASTPRARSANDWASVESFMRGAGALQPSMAGTGSSKGTPVSSTKRSKMRRCTG